MEKKQSKVEELKKKAEASWEGCHGCNESDRDMWINGYIRGALANQIELPSDEEIGKGRDENIPIDEKDMWSERFYFNIGAKWMRDKIKGGENE